DGVLQNGGAELLVHKDAGLFLRHTGCESNLETVVDHLLGRGDLRRLLRGQGPLPAEHLRLERATVIEGQDVQGLVKADGHDAISMKFQTGQRHRIEEKCLLSLSESGTRRQASWETE